MTKEEALFLLDSCFENNENLKLVKIIFQKDVQFRDLIYEFKKDSEGKNKT